MSEKEPEKKKVYTITFEGGQKAHCTSENTAVFYFAKAPNHNHIFISLGEKRGLFLWQRELVERHGYEIWEKMTNDLQDIDCITQFDDYPAQADMAAYRTRFADELEQLSSKAEEPLTERQERFVDYFSYLLENGNITPEDFDGRGNYYI